MARERGGTATKAALIRAAERLMAEHSIEAAQLHQINRAAGQRNKAAVHYHFGDRDGLLAAIGVKHRSVDNAARHRLLDQLERRGEPSIRDLVTAYVLPLAASLADPSGRDYVIILSEATGRRGSRWLVHPDRAHVDSLDRLVAMILAELPGSPAAKRELVGAVMLVVPVLLADIARDINNGILTTQSATRRVNRVIDFVARALTVEL